MKSLYESPEHYDLLFDARSDDLRFYTSLADQAGARVIEYGAGTGRVTVPLAAQGHSVIAVENAPDMVAALHARLAKHPVEVRERVTVHTADARALSLGEQVADLVICPFNGLAHFESARDLAAVFEHVRAHLTPRGLFAFDVWLPAPSVLAGGETRSPWLPDPNGHGRVRCVQRFVYEPMSQVLTAEITMEDDRGRPNAQLALRLRQFFPAETLALLAQHGLPAVHRTTRFAPYTEASAHVSPEARGAPGEMVAYVCRHA